MSQSLDCMGVYYIASKKKHKDIISTWRELSDDFATFSKYRYDDEHFRICLSDYYSVWESNTVPMYFSLPMINWGKNVILDFNNKFKNIQIEILDERIIYYGTIVEKTPYGDKTKTTYFHDKDQYDSNKHEKIYLPLFTVKFKEDYSDLSKYLIPMMVAMYLRLFALNDHYTHFEDEEPEDYLKFACEHNDKFFSTYSIHVFHERGDEFTTLLPEHILWLDDLNLMNNAFESSTNGKYHGSSSTISIGYHVKQTAVINRLYKIVHEGKEEEKPVVRPVVKKVVERKINNKDVSFDEQEFLRLIAQLEENK